MYSQQEYNLFLSPGSRSLSCERPLFCRLMAQSFSLMRPRDLCFIFPKKRSPWVAGCRGRGLSAQKEAPTTDGWADTFLYCGDMYFFGLKFPTVSSAKKTCLPPCGAPVQRRSPYGRSAHARPLHRCTAQLQEHLCPDNDLRACKQYPVTEVSWNAGSRGWRLH